METGQTRGEEPAQNLSKCVELKKVALAAPLSPRGPYRKTELWLNGLLRNTGLVETVSIGDVDKDRRCFTTSPHFTEAKSPSLNDDDIIARGHNCPADREQSLLKMTYR